MKIQFITFAISFISILAKLMTWAIFIHILMSWFVRRPNPFTTWLNQVVRPILRPFRFARLGMLDFSPIVAFLVIDFGAGWAIELLSKLV